MRRLNLRFAAALLEHRELWWRLTERAVASRYKGSALGFGWSLLQPLVMLAVYTFVFSTIFKSRWSGLEEAGSLGYAVNLFAGLIVFNLFADCIGASAGLVVGNKNYVTKVIFPLELLGATTLGSATFQAVTSAVILVSFEKLAFHTVPVTLFWLPLVWLPLLLGCLALSWVVSALGVFLRDLEQLVPMLLSVMMFLSAVFYPISSLPVHVQPLMQFNPLALVIEQTRRVAVEGLAPSLRYLVMGAAIGVVGCEIAYRGFQRARRGFADVL
jgi:lipopolysaccharide transport system permease protein